MFSATDYDKLQQIMEEAPWKKELLTRLLESHRMEVSAISHEIRNPFTLIYSTLQMIEGERLDVTACHSLAGASPGCGIYEAAPGRTLLL